MPPSSRLVIAEPKSPEERAAELEAFCRRIERSARLELFVTCVTCLGFSATGVLLLSWSFASTDQVWAQIAFWSGFGIGYGGVLLTLAEAYRRHIARGG